MKSVNEIKDQMELVIKNGGTNPTLFLSFLFSNIRVTLEKKHEKLKYPILHMYCDWFNHCEIDRSKHGYAIIQKIGDSIIDNISNQNIDIQVLEASNAFGLKKLQHELQSFLSNHDINSVMFSDENWPKILVHILLKLADRPLLLPVPDNKSRQPKELSIAYKYLQNKVQNIYQENWQMIMPKSISIVLEDNRFFYLVEMHQLINIKGPLLKS